MYVRPVARSENPGGLAVMGRDNVPTLVEIGWIDLPKTGGAKAPPAPCLRRETSTWYLVIVYLKLHIKLKVKSWNWPKYVFIWRMHDSNNFIGFNCTLLKYSQPTSFQLSVIFLLFLPPPTFLKEIDLIVKKCFPLLFLVMFFKHEWWLAPERIEWW